MRACIIHHNMIVEDERDVYTQFDVSEFQQGEDTGSSHVDLNFSTNMPTNIANMMGVRTTIRDRQMHQQLKIDLVEYLWSKELNSECFFQIILVYFINPCFSVNFKNYI